MSAGRRWLNDVTTQNGLCLVWLRAGIRGVAWELGRLFRNVNEAILGSLQRNGGVVSSLYRRRGDSTCILSYSAPPQFDPASFEIAPGRNEEHVFIAALVVAFVCKKTTSFVRLSRGRLMHGCYFSSLSISRFFRLPITRWPFRDFRSAVWVLGEGAAGAAGLGGLDGVVGSVLGPGGSLWPDSLRSKRVLN